MHIKKKDYLYFALDFACGTNLTLVVGFEAACNVYHLLA